MLFLAKERSKTSFEVVLEIALDIVTSYCLRKTGEII
jgi:hypothetical protein